MDNSKIQAILASYGGQDTPAVEKDEEEEIRLPKTADEWIERMGLIVWPVKVEEEEKLNITPEDVGTGSLEEILADLAQHAPLDLTVMDEVLRQIEELESKVNVYASRILNIEPSPEKDEENAGTNGCETPPLVRRYRNDEATIIENTKKSREHEMAGHKVKSVENTTYFGFMPNELTPLPGQLESQQLLNKVTKIQNFSKGFKMVWKKAILSQASVAVFQDAFWWFFCHIFQNNHPTDAIFSRISDSFIGLFFSIPSAIKDRFFQYYPNCLAQALYAAFCEAFPDSYKLFNDDFKTTLLDTVCEWVWGVTPPPLSWESWDFHELEPSEIRKPQQSTDKLSKNLTFDMESILNEYIQSPSDKSKAALTPSRLLPPAQKSHPIGAGPDFVQVHFNILGQSPLVSHFLGVKGLRPSNVEAVKKTVCRTEVSKLPSGPTTYRDLINECKRNTTILNEQYSIVLQMSAEESQRIQKQKRACIAKINELENELTRKHSDLKSLGERIYDVVTYADYT